MTDDKQPADGPDEPSKSEQMRQMAAQGMTTSDIARQLGVRYQFVYNVLKAARPARRPDAAPPAEDGPTVREAADEGLTIAEAKRRLALTFGVDPSAITITVQG